MTRVALDLLGGDRAPEQVVDGALFAAVEQPDVEVVLVGPPDTAARLLSERGADGRLAVVPASQVVGMDEDPARGVRAKRDATVRVCARLVRDGQADAMVSVGSTGAALAAAVFTLGRLKGMSRPALAVVVPAKAGPLVFLDAGATVEATPELLGQFALAGAAFASVRLGLERPRIGLLTNGEEPGKGDPLRKEAHGVLAQVCAGLPVEFVGNVEGRDVPFGGVADVVVTDGFTGNVLLKGLEGAALMLTGVLLEALGAASGGADLQGAADRATAHMQPEVLGGGMLLGVDGVVVVGHGSSSPRAVASCIAVAAQAARAGLVPSLAGALERLRATA
ncbi:MAG: phosphate:acyl-(acyl carrier protein) acyltransferase [Frankiales bacterium]|nr:phosphate:acyl-(acyl carrier protein) acyltransferase [Frankiales bacterium]